MKRSTAAEANGVPLGLVSAGANRHDSPLLQSIQAAAKAQVGTVSQEVTAHLDAAYDNGPSRELLAEFGFDGEISRKSGPAPIQVGKRWVVERRIRARSRTSARVEPSGATSPSITLVRAAFSARYSATVLGSAGSA